MDNRLNIKFNRVNFAFHADYFTQTMIGRWKVDHDYATKYLKNFLSSDTSEGFVAYANGMNIGIGLIEMTNEIDFKDWPGPWNRLLFVEPEYRGRDIGWMLTQKRFDWARERGYKEVYLDTKDAFDYHIKKGWTFVADSFSEGEPVKILKYALL